MHKHTKQTKDTDLARKLEQARTALERLKTETHTRLALDLADFLSALLAVTENLAHRTDALRDHVNTQQDILNGLLDKLGACAIRSVTRERTAPKPAIVADVMTYLTANPGTNVTAIRKALKRRTGHIQVAVRELLTLGHIRREGSVTRARYYLVT